MDLRKGTILSCEVRVCFDVDCGQKRSSHADEIVVLGETKKSIKHCEVIVENTAKEILFYVVHVERCCVAETRFIFPRMRKVKTSTV